LPGRFYPAAVECDGRIYVIGGWNDVTKQTIK
jgi:N-acetylneuraminic acid mutarotase